MADRLDPQTGEELRKRALGLLARREHSRIELARKLGARGFEGTAIEAVLDELETSGLLDDRRFAAAFVRSRIQRGQGPVKIRAELLGRGTPPGLATETLAEAEVDWPALAAEVRSKRFGAASPAGHSQRARQARFLEGRGFTSEQIIAALRA